MSVRHFASKTQHDYIRAVMKLARFLGRSPDTATHEDLGRFQLQLTENRAGAPIINRFLGCSKRLGGWTVASASRGRTWNFGDCVLITPAADEAG
jgi:hypothetical protein